MKTTLQLITLLLMFGFTTQLGAQTITISGPTKVYCAPVQPCYSVNLEGSCFFNWGGFVDAQIQVTGPFSPGVDQSPIGVNLDQDGADNASIDEICPFFENPGIYEFCVTAVQDCFFGGGDDIVTTCITIEVVEESPPFVNNPENFCTGDIFSWCPGDWGIQNEIVPPFAVACDPGEAEADENGCIEFEVCADYEGQVYTYTSTRIACDGTIQTTEIDIEFGGGYCIDESAEEGRNEGVTQRSLAGAELSNEVDLIRHAFEVVLSPNPASDIVNIKTSSFNYELLIIDGTGKLLDQFKLSYEGQIDVSDYIPGMYFFILNNGIETSVQKVIVQ